MITGLLDSSLLIDSLRAYTPAVLWLSSQPDLGVSQTVVLELLQGAKDKPEQARTLRMLNQFAYIEVTSLDFDWAISQLKIYKLSHNLDGFDCLIASTAFRLQVPLYTRNLKHFAPMLGGLAQQPY